MAFALASRCASRWGDGAFLVVGVNETCSGLKLNSPGPFSFCVRKSGMAVHRADTLDPRAPLLSGKGFPDPATRDDLLP